MPKLLPLILFFLIIALCSKAQTNLDSIEQILPELKDKALVDALNTLGFEYSYTSLSKAKTYAYKGLKASRETGYQVGEVDALICVGYSLYDFSKYDSAVVVLLQATQLSESIGYQKGQGNAHNALGSVYKKMGQPDKAIVNYKEAVRLNKAVGNYSGMSAGINNIGKVLQEVGDYDHALEYLLEALKINREHASDYKIALNLLNISLNHIQQGEEHLALKYLKEVEQTGAIKGNTKREIGLYNDLGLIAKKERNFEQAISHFEHAVDLNKSMGSSGAIPMHNLAETYLNMGDIHKAEALAKQALALKEESGDISSMVYSLDLLAEVYLEKGAPARAREVSLQALEIAREYGLKEREQKSLKYLSESYSAMGDFKQAWKRRLQYENIRDSVFNEQKAQQQAIMLALYEVEQKEQKIALQDANIRNQDIQMALTKANNTRLIIGIVAAVVVAFSLLFGFIQKNKSNQLLVKQKQAIEQRDHEKELLLKEIHHRVKNNLQIISSILNIQSRNLAEPSAKKAVLEGRSRIKSMSLIHEKLYSTEEITAINMREYIEDLSQYLFSTYTPPESVIKKIEAEDLKLDIDTAIPLGLILNELISNALKHAFSETKEGTLHIRLSQTQEGYSLMVEDTGQGLPSDFEETKSMGMRLIKSLTEQIDGFMNVDNSTGARFTINFQPSQSFA